MSGLSAGERAAAQHAASLNDKAFNEIHRDARHVQVLTDEDSKREARQKSAQISLKKNMF
jgi:hypothetical protein